MRSGRPRGEPAALVVGGPERERNALAEAVAARDGANVAVCGTAKQALAALSPSTRVAAISLDLPDQPAADLIRELRRRAPDLEVLAIGSGSDSAALVAALHAGAMACLAGRESATGQLASYIARALRDTRIGGDAPSGISRRETEVLLLLTRGSTYLVIAKSLGISLGTVQSHIKALYRKLEVRTKAEAAVEAVRRGLL